jgi:hypothetical protein
MAASLLEQDQAGCYVASPALRPTHFFPYQRDQVVITHSAGDPERVLKQRQGLVQPALPY